MVDSLRYLKSVGDQVRRSFLENKTILAFQEYMEAFFEAPRVHARDAAQFIRDRVTEIERPDWWPTEEEVKASLKPEASVQQRRAEFSPGVGGGR